MSRLDLVDHYLDRYRDAQRRARAKLLARYEERDSKTGKRKVTMQQLAKEAGCSKQYVHKLITLAREEAAGS